MTLKSEVFFPHNRIKNEANNVKGLERRTWSSLVKLCIILIHIFTKNNNCKIEAALIIRTGYAPKITRKYQSRG